MTLIASVAIHTNIVVTYKANGKICLFYSDFKIYQSLIKSIEYFIILTSIKIHYMTLELFVSYANQ